MEDIFIKNDTAEPNNYSVIEDSLDSSITALALVERYTVPLICVSGFVGNTISLAVFLQRSLRKKSCSLFLATRSLSDNGFLFILLIVWFSSVFDLRLSRIEGICQSIIFFTYVFGCVSVWLVVFVTIENYIRMCKPYLVWSLCKTATAKFAVIMLLVCVFCCYNFPLWTMTEECVPEAKHYSFIKIMVYADSFLTLVIPAAIMVILMTQIAISSVASWRVRRRLSSASLHRKSRSPMTKVTTMLLAVTLTFFILNMPSHVVRLKLLITSFTEGKNDITESLDLTMQSVSQLIYYLSVAVNIFVYYSFGRTFRRVLLSLFFGKKTDTQGKSNASSFTSHQRNRQTPLDTPDNDVCNNNSFCAKDTGDRSLLQRSQCSAV